VAPSHPHHQTKRPPVDLGPQQEASSSHG